LYIYESSKEINDFFVTVLIFEIEKEWRQTDGEVNREDTGDD
jgi:hypothetical protein